MDEIDKNLLLAFLEDEGYNNLVDHNGVISGTMDFIFTRAIVVGCSWSGHERRYCFETKSDADSALSEWDGVNHPPGNWIKLKGRFNGEPVDMINPLWSAK